MPFGLKDDIITKIKEVFTIFSEIEEAVVYGSRAKGNYKQGSDIDITLKGSKLTHAILNKISLALENLVLPYTFDISIYHHIDNANLIDHINRIGVNLYKKM